MNVFIIMQVCYITVLVFVAKLGARSSSAKEPQIVTGCIVIGYISVL
jgi:hypothetical protein